MGRGLRKRKEEQMEKERERGLEREDKGEMVRKRVREKGYMREGKKERAWDRG